MWYTIPGEILNPTPDEQAELIHLMRKFQSARRFAHNRLLEGMDKRELVPTLQRMFIPNARYCQWAVLKAEKDISSRRALLPLYVRDLETKIARSQAKLAKVRSEKRRRGIRARIEKLKKQRDEYQRHIEAGTIPPVVFGGRRNFQLLQKGKLSREKWRELRSNSFYSRGQANQHGPNGQYGNANTELIHREGNLFDLAVRIPTGQGRGKDRWLGLTVYVPTPYVSLLSEWLASGRAYSVEVRRRDGRFYCHITLDLPAVKKGDTRNGVAGIDVNPQGIAVTIVYPDGNYKASRHFPCPELAGVSANKRDWLIGNLVRDGVRWVKSEGCRVVAIEDLSFRQTHDTDHRFNRISHFFAHRKIIQTVRTRCWKEGLGVVEVNPAFTTIIGQVKYAQTYGLSSHQAAALVIARRALGFGERIPLALTRVVFGTEDKLSSWKAWGEVAKWLAKVRRHAARNGLNPNGWSLSEYLRYPVRPRVPKGRPK